MRTRDILIALPLGYGLFLVGCNDSEPTTPEVVTANASCIGCHTDLDALTILHTPDSVMPTAGCSGPPPYIEPYDRVYLEPAGFAEFQGTIHGRMECVICHGGVDETDDKELAHSGDFVQYPSFENLSQCAECHLTEVQGIQNSLHYNGWGQKNSQVTRSGVGSFDELHQGVQVGYEQNCATCHASCGSCHINRPPAMGGGLMNGHEFSAPNMRDNCTACHSSRGGHAYYGEGLGTKPDVHLTQAGFTCMECHSKSELHNTSREVVDHRYQVEALPSCADCHQDLTTSNAYHTEHIEELSCHTCHSQDYNTCGNCHVGGEGARIHAFQSFKIGRNPIPEERGYKYTTLRRTLAAPDTWEAYGLDQLPNFDDKQLYTYTTPHNILLWTSRTQVAEGASCSDNCHIVQDGDTWLNRNLYLFSSDFNEQWERNATQNVVVDGQLPAAWGNH